MVREYHSAVTINLAKRLEIPIRNFSRNELYSKLPICSFTLKAKIPKKFQSIRNARTLGEHIKKERLKRKEQQQVVAKLLNVNSMHLSLWEHNHKSPHSKYVKSIVKYLRYIPEVNFKSERLGTLTQLYRLKHKISIEEFCQMTNIDSNVLRRIETMRSYKVSDDVEKMIFKAVNNKN